MAKQVGLSRNINIEWLSSVANYAINGQSREEAKEELNKEIGMKISSSDNIRKTREILLHIWYDNDEFLLERAKKIYPEVGSNEKLAIHWALITLYYPIFYDLCSTIGHVLNYKDTINTQQIKQAIFEKWGERQTLVHSLSKNMQTLKDIGAVYEAGKSGQYKIKDHAISDYQAIGLLLAAILKSDDKTYISWPELKEHASLFPFSMSSVDESYMAALDYIELNRFNGKVAMQLRECGGNYVGK